MRVIWGLTSLALGLTLAACGGADLGDCPDNSSADQTAGKQIMQTTCKACHGSFDLDSFSKDTAEDWYTEIDDGSMPPSGSLGDTEIEQVRVFLSCQNGG